jgi:energy-converting hydrogenase A subunit M
MRARKIERLDSFIYLLSGWKYAYSKQVFLRLRAKESGYDIYDFRFARFLPAINLDRLFLRAIRLGQVLKITLDENSDIMFKVISFATSDKNLIVSTLDTNPYRVINVVESNNRWIVNAMQFFEADSTIRCESFFLREFGEFIGKAIAVVKCPRSRIELVDFGKKEARDITNNIRQIGYMLTISRRNRANVVEDIETMTSNNKQELIDILKKKLTRETETQLAKT